MKHLHFVRRAAAVTAAAVGFAFCAAAPAFAADNTLVDSSPAAGSTVEASPPALVLRFANPLGTSSSVTVQCNGAAAGVGDITISADQLVLTAALPTALPNGACVLSWTVSQPDGTAGGTGGFTFNVGPVSAAAAAAPPSTVVAGAPTTNAPAGSSSGTPSSNGGKGSGAPLGLSRVAVFLALAVLFGSFVLIATAWPEGVEYILTVRFLRWVWIGSVIAAVFNAACTAAQISGNNIGSSLFPTGWGPLTDTTPGVAALARVLFVVASGWVVLRPERVIDPATQLLGLALPGLSVATLAFSRAGEEMALLGYVAGILHGLGMAVWFGGLVLLGRVVLAGPGEEDLVHAVRGFARISNPALLVTVLTGAVQQYRLDGGELGSSHFKVLLLKVAAVIVMVVLGVAARQFIRQRISRVDAMTAPLAFRLRRAVGVEALCGVVVLVITAWLMSITPPRMAEASTASTRYGPPVVLANADQGADLTVLFSQVVGLNAVRVEVRKPTANLSGLVIDFTAPPESAVPSISLPVPLTGAGAAALPIDRGIPLNSPGLWTITARVGTTILDSKTVVITGATSTAGTTTTAADS